MAGRMQATGFAVAAILTIASGSAAAADVRIVISGDPGLSVVVEEEADALCRRFIGGTALVDKGRIVVFESTGRRRRGRRRRTDPDTCEIKVRSFSRSGGIGYGVGRITGELFK